MRAAILEKGRITVGDLPDPEPAAGHVLVRTHCCAMCASDQHFMCSGHEMIRQSQQFGGPYATIDLDRPIVMGHEYVGEIVDYGPGSRRRLEVGTRVTSIPAMLQGPHPGVIGYQNELPGGYGEYMLLDENLLMEIPEGMPDEHAALIEPLAVGLEHARVGEPVQGDIPLVIGCGAIGLGVIAGLRLAGVGPIIAADLDPGRRRLAQQMGADIAIDPREVSPYEPFAGQGIGRPNLVYECVGKAGMLHQMILGVGNNARIVMGGFALDPEQLYVPPAQIKRLKIFFARGEEPQDMKLAMESIADGRVDIRPWLGEKIGLEGVATAIADMADPSKPVRTIVDPRVQS
jgi:threonine dehydrogenase-like Zn-dependent dehydrogenase